MLWIDRHRRRFARRRCVFVSELPEEFTKLRDGLGLALRQIDLFGRIRDEIVELELSSLRVFDQLVALRTDRVAPRAVLREDGPLRHRLEEVSPDHLLRRARWPRRRG